MNEFLFSIASICALVGTGFIVAEVAIAKRPLTYRMFATWMLVLLTLGAFIWIDRRISIPIPNSELPIFLLAILVGGWITKRSSHRQNVTT